MYIIKRNGEKQLFDYNKIIIAITKANKIVEKEKQISKETIKNIASKIKDISTKSTQPLNVEEVQDLVENEIMKLGAFDLARKYITYRYSHSLTRRTNTTDEQILTLIDRKNEELTDENSNKNANILSLQRDYIAGEVSKDLCERFIVPEEIMKAHKEGLIHFHDLDYFAQKMHNCCLINLEDMLQNGTVINDTMIEKPKSFSIACNIATQIIAQVASNQYGGQSISLTHLAPFVEISRQKIKKELTEELKLAEIKLNPDKFDKIVEKRVKSEIKKGIQTIQYQVVTLMTTNGQAPFITVFMYLGEARNEQEKKDLALMIEETLKQRMIGVKNKKGIYITPSFPKLIYVLEEQNIHKDSPYFYLTELSAQCSAKRLVPDYISEKKMKELKIDQNGNGQCYTCMGCRSFLTPYIDENGKPKYYGRFNQGVVTINLVDIALSSQKSLEQFWKIFDERLELCHKALQCRHERLTGTLSDVAPILWQHGVLARLQPGEKIDKLLHNGYSTISLGYAGLWETVYYMTGNKLTENKGKAFALEVLRKLNEYTNLWKMQENIDYSLYGTPLESTTYKFAKCLRSRFGSIAGVSDKNYISNSYHVHVTEQISAFDKLALESEFQELSPGGAISYIEVPNMQNNTKAILNVIKFIYDNIMYAEINTKSDYCMNCGYNQEIQIVQDGNRLIWKCPNCNNTDQTKMNIARRTCGYIGTQYWNQGRTQEIKERVLHL